MFRMLLHTSSEVTVNTKLEHVTATGHSLKWDHFEILAGERSGTHCKIKEILLIKDLKPT